MALITLVERLRSATRTFGGNLLLGVATMATTPVWFMANFVGVRYIGPAQMGMYQTLMLIPA